MRGGGVKYILDVFAFPIAWCATSKNIRHVSQSSTSYSWCAIKIPINHIDEANKRKRDEESSHDLI